MTEPLSPAAQQVRHVAICAGPELEGRIAAALRAAADQVVPGTEYKSYEVFMIAMNVRHNLLAIAAELEGGNG